MSPQSPDGWPPELRRLLDLLDNHFNLEELRDLCLSLGVEFDNLGGEGKRSRMRELLRLLQRQKRTAVLLEEAEQLRPKVDWHSGPRPDAVCPYKGLYAFGEEDAANFFGREAFTERLVEAVQEQSLVAVVGPSGSGKSSVVFAGLIPCLRQQENWLIAHFRPGSDPFLGLAQGLLPILDPEIDMIDRPAKTRKLANHLQAGEASLGDYLQMLKGENPTAQLLLICDQFEELYTQVAENARRRFLDVLLADGNEFEAHSFETLVLTLRADFMGQALAYSPMMTALQNNDIKIGLMSSDELTRAIEQPALNAGVAFEEGLAGRILTDVGEHAGNLPLLEFALTLLWERQSEGQMTHAAYEAIGGVSGALAGYADEALAKLTKDNPVLERTIQRVMVQLVHPGAGAEDTRRVARRADLGEEGWALVPQLADARLLVTSQLEKIEVEETTETTTPESEETVEVIHEALIQNWGRLQAWMERDREFRMWQERLRTDREQWQENDQDDGFLLQGAPLTVACDWQDKRKDDLSTGEIAYIEASRQQQHEREAAEENRRQHELAQAQQLAAEQKKGRERLRQIVGMLIGGLIIVVILAVLLFSSTQTAQENVAIAQTRAVEAEVSRIGAQAQTLVVEANYWLEKNRFDLGLIKAYQAVSITYRTDGFVTKEASTALHNVYNQLARFPVAQFQHDDFVISAVFRPDQDLILTTSDDTTARLWDFDGNQVALFQHDGSVLVHPYQDLIFTTGNDTTSCLWDFDGNQLALFTHDYNVTVVFHPDQDLILTKGDYTVRLWEFDVNQHTLFQPDEPVYSAVFHPDQDVVLATGNDNAHLWDFDGNQFALFQHDSKVNSAVFHPDQDLILTTTNDSSGDTLKVVDYTAHLWDFDGNQLALFQHDSTVSSAIFHPYQDLILTASNDTTARLWDFNGNQVALFQHDQRVNSAVFHPDQDLILTASNDTTARLWDFNGNQLTLFQHDQRVHSAVFHPDQDLILTTSDDTTARLWDFDGNQLALFQHDYSVHSAIFHPDQDLILTAIGVTTIGDATAHLWDFDGNQLALFQYDGYIRSAVFHPDQDLILTTSWDTTARLWDFDGNQLALFQHDGYIHSAVFHPDQDLVLTTSDDTTARLWDFDGNQLALFQHDRRVSSAVFHPDQDLILTTSDDTTALLWRYFPTYDEMLAEAERNLRMVLSREECAQYFADFALAFCARWDK